MNYEIKKFGKTVKPDLFLISQFPDLKICRRLSIEFKEDNLLKCFIED